MPSQSDSIPSHDSVGAGVKTHSPHVPPVEHVALPVHPAAVPSPPQLVTAPSAHAPHGPGSRPSQSASVSIDPPHAGSVVRGHTPSISGASMPGTHATRAGRQGANHDSLGGGHATPAASHVQTTGASATQNGAASSSGSPPIGAASHSIVTGHAG